MIYIASIFVILAVNLFVQTYRKAHLHFELLKSLKSNGIKEDDSYFMIAATGSHYKHPTLMLPYIEHFSGLEGEQLQLYNKVKFRIRLVIISFLGLVGYFGYLFFIY